MKDWLRIDEIPPSIGIDPSVALRTRYPPQGMTSDVAFVACGDQDVVVKRCKVSIYLPWLRREYDVLRCLSDTKLPVPKPIGYVERVGPSGPEAWLTMTKLPGRSLELLLAGMARDDRITLMRNFGSAVRNLHTTRAPRRLSDKRSWLSRKLNEAESHLAWCDGSAALLDTLVQSKPDEVPETLVHGDLNFDNVLVDQSGDISFIDWSGGDVGDPRYDLALALNSDETLVAAEIAAFYSAYDQAPLDAQTEAWFVDLCEFF